MAEHDYVIANQNGANTRSDLNNALAAIVSNNSKATAPTTTYAYMWWADTANDILKQRNAADSAWISILTLSTGIAINTAALTSADMPAGSVLQVVTATDSTQLVLATSTYTDVGLSANITLRDTSSKVLVMWGTQCQNPAGASGGWGTRLVRGATNIYTSANQYESYLAADQRMSKEHKKLDSPATTASLTYKIQVGCYLNRSLTFNQGGNQSQIILMEIGA